MTDPYTFGIEEEFFLVNPKTRSLATRAPKSMSRQLSRKLGEQVAHELLQSQIELVSPVFSDLAEASRTMTRLRSEANAIAAEFGLRLLAAGTHPLASWTDQVPTDAPRYGRLMEDFRILGRRNVVCGLHVHVAVPAHIDRVILMNRVTRWLPLFLSLSTSSPFWNRHRTGLLSYRQSAYDEWPRSGIPDVFDDEPQFNGFIELLKRTGAARDASYLWWAIRPSAKLPTLELRIADACTRVEDGIAIAALYRCLVALLIRRPELGRERSPATRPVVDENRWRAKRYGTKAEFIDDQDGTVASVSETLGKLRELGSEEIAHFGCEAHLNRLETLGQQGTSADQQLAIYTASRGLGRSRTAALQEVVDWLIETTVPGDNAPRT